MWVRVGEPVEDAEGLWVGEMTWSLLEMQHARYARRHKRLSVDVSGSMCICKPVKGVDWVSRWKRVMIWPLLDMQQAEGSRWRKPLHVAGGHTCSSGKRGFYMSVERSRGMAPPRHTTRRRRGDKNGCLLRCGCGCAWIFRWMSWGDMNVLVERRCRIASPGDATGGRREAGGGRRQD